jgi:rRNA maturation RNase YbeY
VKIQFVIEENSLRFIEEKKLKEIICIIAKDCKKQIGELIFHFVNDSSILEINRNFLNHDYFTDIITFDSSFINIINGEIFISFETVKSNSLKFSSSFKEELYRVIFHGVIHLCGFNDSTESEKNVMRAMENKYLSLI